MISVVIPLYNKEQYISRSIQSVLNQSVAVSEIIVVNDGSTDNSLAVVKDAFLHETKVRIIEQENKGVSAARNTGIENASSEYIAFLDADDLWLPSFINNIHHLIDLVPNAVMFATQYGFYSTAGRHPAVTRLLPDTPGKINDYFASCVNADLPVTASSVCIRKDTLNDIGCFPVGMIMGEDQVVWAKVACQGEIMYHPELSVYYDLGVEYSACSTHKVLEPAPQVSYYAELIKSGSVPEHLITSLRRLMSLTIVSCAKNNLLDGNSQAARQILLSHPNLIWDKYRIYGLIATLIPRVFIAPLLKIVRNRK